MIVLFSLYTNILNVYCYSNAIIVIYYYNIYNISKWSKMHVCAHMQMEGLSLTSMGDQRAGMHAFYELVN